MKEHKTYIKRCISLAKNGLGTSYPNPLVGCVIVHEKKIIGEGWHYKAGQAHAEVHAINAVQNKQLLTEATIYVSLEPCSHFGKTPPCADLIIQHKIPKVVVGCIDSYSEVSGRGIKRLRNHGCEVIVGVLEKECLDLNKRFFSFHNKNRPYIFLKWAETTDGYIAPENNSKITWISNRYSRQLTHKLRATEQAILIGTNTAVTDNPKLNTRNWYGISPIRIVLDRELKIPDTHDVFDNCQKTIVLTSKETTTRKTNITYECINFSELISEIIRITYKHNIQSLIVEGGHQTLQTFINHNCWDEALCFVGKSNFNKGIKAPKINKNSSKTICIETDLLKTYSND